jgi:hypothetical protein
MMKNGSISPNHLLVTFLPFACVVEQAVLVPPINVPVLLSLRRIGEDEEISAL